MSNDALKEFAKMMEEELKKSKAGGSDTIQEQKIEEKQSTAIEVSKYLSRPKNIKEDIQSDHNNLLNISNDSNNIPSKPSEIEAQRWNDPLRPLDQKFVTVKEMNDHYGLFLQRIQQQMATIGGGGEVNFRGLDDVNRSTLTSSNDNWILEYDASTKKVQFTEDLGPIQTVIFDTTHDVNDHGHEVGTICWNEEDDTINVFHPGGVTQQVGQELYAYVRNKSGSEILNGTVVRFSGAEENGVSRLLVAPFLADGAFPSLYGLGIATQTIPDDEDGKITVWGKVRGIDTSAWNIGDVLYVSSSTSGNLTNIKPTAPDNVIPMAVVIKKDTLDGEVFVRPTIEQHMYYGRFAKTTDQAASEINTGYPIEFDATEISNRVTIGSPPSRIITEESGFYQFDVSAQVTASSNKGVILIWFRKNGVDVPLSSRRTTVTNGDTFTVHSTLQLSLLQTDYIELIWASTAAGIILDANPSPPVGPTVASVLLSVGQIQL